MRKSCKSADVLHSHQHLCCCGCTSHLLYVQYDQNLAEPALDYVGGDAGRLSDPLVSPLLADYNRRPFPPTLMQV